MYFYINYQYLLLNKIIKYYKNTNFIIFIRPNIYYKEKEIHTRIYSLCINEKYFNILALKLILNL